MVFFLLFLIIFLSFFLITAEISGYLSVDKKCVIFVVKIYKIKAFKIIIRENNGIFEFTINGQVFNKKPKKSDKKINFKNIIAIDKIFLRINAGDFDAYKTALILGAINTLNIKRTDVKVLDNFRKESEAFFNLKLRVSLYKGVINGY